jgi:hypothetical protein
VRVLTRFFVGQPTDTWSFLGTWKSTKQVRCLQRVRPCIPLFFGPPRIASEFFSLTHHNRWQYTSCNIPSDWGHPDLGPNAGRQSKMAAKKTRTKSAKKPAAKKAPKVAKKRTAKRKTAKKGAKKRKKAAKKA